MTNALIVRKTARLPALAAALSALLLTGACASQLSAVDLAPYAERPRTSPLEPGRYCTASNETGDWRVEADDCGRIGWDAQTRMLTLADDEDPDDVAGAPLSAMGKGLYLIQDTDEDPEPPPHGGPPTPYSILLAFAQKRAALALPVLPDAPRRELAARHSKVTFGNMEKSPAILAGERKDILRFLRESGALVAQHALDTDADIGVLVREDRAGEDLAPTRAQRADIDRVLKRMRALAAKAPGGVDMSEPASEPSGEDDAPDDAPPQ